ncbi:hypothetical protein SLOPH_779 [Spraguea lophii 42_110]|uniref:Uncharacterized protein n=1 Tax=Spraguea lophii (strain 42_110) TaxID=1358809 RepID=S7W7H6_SPRLO|nr:hypothetical protein SLOPH_779 [Spraguea lophii 42_110]
MLKNLVLLYNRPSSILCSFNSFKISYLNKLSYLDDNMLEIYEIAFYLYFYPNDKKYIYNNNKLNKNISNKSKIDNKISNNKKYNIRYKKMIDMAIKEVKDNYKNNIKEVKQDRIICGLYRIK